MERSLCIAVVIALLLSGCGTMTGEVVAEEEIVIGSIQALTGNIATWGLWSQRAIDLAVEEVNEEGGINGKRVRVIHEDSPCVPSKAVGAFQKLHQAHRIKVLIGPTCSPDIMAVAPLAEESKTLMLVTVGSAPDYKEMGSYTFRVKPASNHHGKALAAFAWNELGAENAAIIHINAQNGVGYRDSFTEAYTALGGKIVSVESWERGTTGFKTQVLKTRTANPDVILITPGGNHEALLKEIKEMGITVPIIGADLLTPALADYEHLENIYYSHSAYEWEHPLTARYEQRWPNELLGIPFIETYSGTKILLEADASVRRGYRLPLRLFVDAFL
jgi:branched-chain amino acid transport system substrate-binding protein